MLGSRVRVRSDTLSDAGERKTFWIEQRSGGRNDGVQHGRNDGTQPMNESSRGEEILDKHHCKSSRYPASSWSAAAICCADKKSSIAGCNIIDDKVLCGGMEDFNDDERAKKLAKLDTGLCEGMINPSQSNLVSAKEKHNDGDDGFKFLNHNAICSKMKDKGVSNMREEHGHRRNEALALLPESEYPYGKPLHKELGNYNSQSPECSMQEEDHIDEQIDYRRIFSKHMEIKGKTHSPQSMPALSVTNMLQACRSIHEYQRVSKISEGVYGVVFKAQDKKTGEIVAIKKVKMEREKDGFPITSLREINILLSMDHPSIVVVKEIAVDDDLEGVYMVMEYMEQDLAGLLETHNGSFSQGEVKFMMLQLLEGVEFIHSKWVLHRDLKPSNLLVDRKGMLKICDFGLARQYGSPLKTYTHKVVSLRYRDPMLLLGSCKYSTAVDMWSLGCIMAELLGKVPLFKGCSELDQLKKIVAILGSPDETVLQNKLSGVQFNFLREPSKGILREIFPPTSFTGKTPLSEKGFNLLSRLLNYDAHKRITAEDAVRHDWFREDPLPKPLNLPAY